MAGAPEGKTYAWRLCGWGARPGLDPPSPLSESQSPPFGLSVLRRRIILLSPEFPPHLQGDLLRIGETNLPIFTGRTRGKEGLRNGLSNLFAIAGAERRGEKGESLYMG